MKNSNGMKKFKIASMHLIVLSFFIVPFFIYAQPTPTTPPTVVVKIENPFDCGSATCDLMSLITAVLNKIVMPIAAVAVVIWIIWAGFTYLMANGNPTELKKAHSRLLWSLIGAGLLLGAAGISAVIENTIKGLIKP